MSIKKVFIVSFIIGLCIPLFTHAQIKITEIMYDPEGSDTKREWIEVYNSGTQSIDLNTYFFFENNIHHKLTTQSASILAPGAYAIIADSIPEVLADFSGYTGLIFDSVFSLNNTGETISISNPQKEIFDTVTYTSDMGGNNTGQSLQINDGSVITAGPTFSSTNKTVSEVIEEETKTSTSTSSTISSKNSSHSQQTDVSTYTSTSFKIGTGRNRFVSINTPIDFESHISKSDIKARYVWNFGDFNTDTGKNTNHIYEYPGVYQLVLTAKADNYTAVSRTEVIVIEPQFSITEATSTIQISNVDSREINLGGFRLLHTNGFVSIPQNTIIKAGDTITIPRRWEGLIQSIQYPNKRTYKTFGLNE